tara:strand:- start:17877 stop:18758 length:882 start_codon:yes stop_codon:yes gene_type:complete
MEKGLQIYQKRQERYLALMSSPEVISIYSSLEKRVIDGALKDTIEIISDEFLIEKVAILTKYICMDLGIKDRHDAEMMKYINSRLFTMLKGHYSDFTIEDIKLAFELLEIGTLDKWLPTNNDGTPNREHYQSFNVKFYTKVLNAYRNYKKEIFGKGQRHLYKLKSGKELVISPEQRAANSQVTIDDISAAFNLYKFESVKPNFILSIFITTLIEKGKMILPEPSVREVIEAKNEIAERETSRNARKSMLENYHNGIISSQIESLAQIKANNNAMTRYFDILIANKQTIKTELQ